MGLDTDETNGIATEMGIPDHSRFRGTHAGPALQRKVVLIHDGSHDFANVERLLASRIGLVGENLTDMREFAVAAVRVWIRPDVPVDGIVCHIFARKALTRRHVSVFIMARAGYGRLHRCCGPSTAPGRWDP